MKVGLIVEGDSDKLFFEKYFKPKLKRDIIVTSSGGKDGCKILNKKEVHKDITALLKRKCEKIYVLVDLDTQCTQGQQFTNYESLKSWYKSKIDFSKLSSTSIVVVIKEIESWMLSAWENSNNKSKEDLKKKFDNKKKLTEEDLVKRFLSSKKDIDRTQNNSLDYFLTELGI